MPAGCARNWKVPAGRRRGNLAYNACSGKPVATSRPGRDKFRRRYKGKYEECLAFVAEALDVFGAFRERQLGAALDEFANLLDNVGIRERSDVVSIHVVGDGGENAAHDFARTGL